MLNINDYLIIFFLGSIGGFISGFLGVGGGIVYIPILDYFLTKLGLQQDALVKGILANSLFTIFFSGSIASYKQYKSGNFYPKEILQTAIPGIITALFITYLIRNGNWYSKEIFNYVFAAMLLIISLRMLLAKPVISDTEKVISNNKYRLTGFFAGLVTAFSGLGGGVVMTPVFTDLLKQTFKKASSVSNGVIPMFALFVGLYNLSGEQAQVVHQYQIGYIVFPLVLPMVLAAVFLTPLGVKVSHQVKPLLIRNIFAIFVSLIFIKTIYEIFTR